jgi:hypothetical protein
MRGVVKRWKMRGVVKRWKMRGVVKRWSCLCFLLFLRDAFMVLHLRTVLLLRGVIYGYCEMRMMFAVSTLGRAPCRKAGGDVTLGD